MPVESSQVDELLEQEISKGDPTDLVSLRQLASKLEQQVDVSGEEIYEKLSNGYLDEYDGEFDLEPVIYRGELHVLGSSEEYPAGVVSVTRVREQVDEWFSRRNSQEELPDREKMFPRTDQLAEDVYESNYTVSEYGEVRREDIEAAIEFLKGDALGVVDNPAPPAGGEGVYRIGDGVDE